VRPKAATYKECINNHFDRIMDRMSHEEKERFCWWYSSIADKPWHKKEYRKELP